MVGIPTRRLSVRPRRTWEELIHLGCYDGDANNRNAEMRGRTMTERGICFLYAIRIVARGLVQARQ